MIAKHRRHLPKLSLSLILGIGLSLFCNAPAFAWHDFGHMLVAYIAYTHLTPAKKARVDALLKLNPMYSQWIERMPAALSEEDKNARVAMLAATWPDAIKFDSSYKADGLAGGNRPDGTAVCTQNIGYADHNLHKYWHFCDLHFSQDESPLPPTPTPNAQTQIATFRAVIASDSNDELKSYDLTWLLHIIGDIHQPMHCATRISKADPSGDNGGNKVLLTSDEKLLHSFWDGVIGETAIDTVAPFAKTLKPAAVKAVKESDERDWIDESFALAKKKVYKTPIKNSNGPFTLTKSYRKAALAVARDRVELAGERLANVINNELK